MASALRKVDALLEAPTDACVTSHCLELGHVFLPGSASGRGAGVLIMAEIGAGAPRWGPSTCAPTLEGFSNRRWGVGGTRRDCLLQKQGPVIDSWRGG